MIAFSDDEVDFSDLTLLYYLYLTSNSFYIDLRTQRNVIYRLFLHLLFSAIFYEIRSLRKLSIFYTSGGRKDNLVQKVQK